MPTSCRQAQQTPGNSPLAFSSRLRVASWWSTRVGVFTPHWMRGTMATLMVRSGANAFVIKKAGRWKRMDTALRYVQVAEDDAEEAQRKAFDIDE